MFLAAHTMDRRSLCLIDLSGYQVRTDAIVTFGKSFSSRLAAASHAGAGPHTSEGAQVQQARRRVLLERLFRD